MRDSQPYTLGIDIGGTFTDLVVLSEKGEVVTSKAATTPHDFSTGVMDAISEVAKTMATPVGELLRQTKLVKHGSTVATNALITRGGVKVGFITTHGFEDTTLIMRTIGRVDGLPEEEVRHVTWVNKPDPLVPPELIRGVRERIDAQGRVVVPLNRADAERAIRELVEQEGVQALAVSLLHAWINPSHEDAIRQILDSLYPNGQIYCSFGGSLSQVAGEYARSNTAICNSYVGPTVHRYLKNLEDKLGQDGFSGSLLVMQGNGGLASREQATPISTLQSGPAGGMLASGHMAGILGHQKVITADMGGTSFDVGLIHDGYWRYADEPIFERFRILQPVADINSIGAGGGTIARVEGATNRLLVGPQSAGASPGPACYGTGGDQPTVTDADLVLGYIDPEYFLGGRRKLDKPRAEHAIEEHLARPLGMSVVEAAAGVYQIINNKMSDLIRRQVVRSGHLPDEYVLYAFGGASPVHAVGYAHELGIKQIHVFDSSSVFSAFGVAMADVVHTRVATRDYALPVDPEVLNRDLSELEDSLLGDMEKEDIRPDTVTFRRFVSMRFRRQTSGEEMALPWDRFTAERVRQIGHLFALRYEELYGAGAAYEEAGVDLAALRVDAIGAVPRPDIRPAPTNGASAGSGRKGARRAYFDGGFVETPIFDHGSLAPGQELSGPAIVESPFTTIVLPPGCSAQVDGFHTLVIAL